MLLPFRATGLMIRSVRWLGLGAVLAALPFAVTASTVTASYNFILEGITGSVVATYDSTATPLYDSTGAYLDASDGLESLDVTWNGNTYTMAEAIDNGTLPELFLPGNKLATEGGYGFLGDWVVPGSGGIPGGNVLGISANVPAYLATDVTLFSVGGGVGAGTMGDPSTTVDIGIDYAHIYLGTIPEPVLLPLLALGLAGFWFARRRRATL